MAIFLPNCSENHPKGSTKAMPPKDESEDIQDSSFVVIFPELKGVASDLKSSRCGPGKPIETPKMKAVKFTASIFSITLLLNSRQFTKKCRPILQTEFLLKKFRPFFHFRSDRRQSNVSTEIFFYFSHDF